ncbi:hypothetical protein C0033_11135 [Clostridium sp. chh4-2]|nr:hypothetical protein C0033_11135 [Clostridium sp. chh4-2]
MPSGFTLNVKSFRKMTSPFTLNGEGITEKALMVDIKTYSPIRQIFFSSASQATAGKKEEPGRAADIENDRGSCADP